MFNGKTIVIIDDELSILKSFKKWFNKSCPENDIFIYNEYSPLCITSDVDAVIIDFYLGRNITAPELIKEMRESYPDLLIIATSGAFVLEDQEVTCYNNEIMVECMESGATRVSPKNTDNIVDILSKHFTIRDAKNLLEQTGIVR